MTVVEFIEWLKTQDQGATVEFLTTSHCGYTVSEFLEVFDPEKASDYSDLRGNSFVPADAPYKDSRTLYLGRKS